MSDLSNPFLAEFKAQFDAEKAAQQKNIARIYDAFQSSNDYPALKTATQELFKPALVEYAESFFKHRKAFYMAHDLIVLFESQEYQSTQTIGGVSVSMRNPRIPSALAKYQQPFYIEVCAIASDLDLWDLPIEPKPRVCARIDVNTPAADWLPIMQQAIDDCFDFLRDTAHGDMLVLSFWWQKARLQNGMYMKFEKRPSELHKIYCQ